MLSTDADSLAVSWARDIEQRGYIVLENSDDECLVIDAAQPWNAVLAQVGEVRVSENLEASRQQERLPVRRCEILYVGDWPPPDPAAQSIIAVAREFGARHTKFHAFPTNAQTDLVGGLNRFAGDSGRCAVNLNGAIPELDDDEIGTLIRRGASVTYTAGWPNNQAVDTDAIRRMSDLGLRIPVAYYVHRDNLGSVIADAERLLDITYHSGVSFLPACAHPLFRPEWESQLPDPDDYCELLVEAYSRFPHYDDVFEPIASLVDRLSNGGWDSVGDHDLPARYRIDSDGTINEFRQLPWQAVPVAAKMPVGGRRLATLSDPCQSCRWLRACGGCDISTEATFAVICNHRMLFLEFFIRQMHERLSQSHNEG